MKADNPQIKVQNTSKTNNKDIHGKNGRTKMLLTVNSLEIKKKQNRAGVTNLSVKIDFYIKKKFGKRRRRTLCND